MSSPFDEEGLSKQEKVLLLWNAASTSDDETLLEYLAKNGTADVRWRVADNPFTPYHLVVMLSQDDDYGVNATAQKRLGRMRH